MVEADRQDGSHDPLLRPRRGRVRELPSARVRFFLFGPFYLLWQRLWIDAVVCALIIWAVVHGIVVATASMSPVNTRPSARAALDAIAAFQNAANLGIPADDAARGLVAALLPFYVSGFALILLMSVLTFYLPEYMDWRFRRQGHERLIDESEA